MFLSYGRGVGVVAKHFKQICEKNNSFLFKFFDIYGKQCPEELE